MIVVKQQLIGFYTIIRRELVRMFRISSQVFIPPVIQTLLYFLIFGSVIGRRIGLIDGVSYMMFIAPGLILMAVIVNSYSNVCTSLFNVRFQKSIEEMLISPLHYSFILMGFIFGGVLRGIIVGFLVFLIALCFLNFDLSRLPGTILVVVLVSLVFSLAGFLNGMLARNFDEVALVPTFVLTPLTYLGGIFYDSHMLAPFWQKITHFNPIFYMVSALRYAMIGQHETNMPIALLIMVLMIVILAMINAVLLKKGIGLRE
jgi:ABC-2 type transport system permease protein